jgi:hypothetical protein
MELRMLAALAITVAVIVAARLIIEWWRKR